jgi:transposase InsO family protein
MSTQRQWFKTFEPHAIPIRIANDAIVYSKGIASIVMEPLDESLDPVCLSCVLYIPALQNNLFAVLHLVTSHRFHIVIKGTVMEFLRNGVRILTATIRDKTAWLDVRTANAPESALRGEMIHDRSLWHRRLGHIGKDLLEKVIKGKLASGLHLDSDAPLLVHCKPCIVGKHHANPFPAKASHCATRMLERVHSDLHMVPTATASGYRYWMTFINNWLRYGWMYLLKHKLDAFQAFKTFKAMVEKQYDLPILCFHEDKGGEYIGHVWDEFFAKHGFQREHTQPANAAAPALPNVKEESNHAPGPSRTPAESDSDVNPFYTAPASPDEFDFLSGPHAADSAHVVRRWQGMQALLAQGIESVYGKDNKHLLLPQALEHVFAACSDKSEPRTLRDALKRPDANLWYQAAVKEMEAHIENGTWELVKLPPGRKAIGSQWVFKVKRNADGSVERYKARVVAQGFSQRLGVDFDETFAPTTKWADLRVIFALAALEDWEVESIDISNAYLNGELKDVKVYMCQPEGFAEKDNTWVARLLKGLYGLKQGGQEWFKRLEEVLS